MARGCSLCEQHELHIKEHSGPSIAPSPPILSIVWKLLPTCDLLCYHFTMSSSIILSSSPLFNCSVSNSYKLIFVKIRAKYRHFFGKNTAVIRAKLRAKLSFCDVVVFMCTFRALLTFFAKQPNNALNLHFISKIRAKSQKYERYTGDFPQMPVYNGVPI